MSEFSQRAGKKFKMSSLLQNPYFFNLSIARKDYRKSNNNDLLDGLFSGWGKFEPEWWNAAGGLAFLGMLYGRQSVQMETYLKMIDLHQPEMVLITDRMITIDEMEDFYDLVPGKRINTRLNCPHVVYPSKGMDTGKLYKKLEKKLKKRL